MSETVYRIPPSTLSWLERVPGDAPVAVLLRHSVRPFLAPGEMGLDLSITEAGERLARALGQLLGPRLKSVHVSPVLRCVQTGEAMLRGAGSRETPRSDPLLGLPGVFVVDGLVARRHWQERDHEGLLHHLQTEDAPLPGMAAAGPAAHFLVHAMLSRAAAEPGIHAFVTHDLLVAVTAGRLLRRRLGKESWPWYLEGAFFWRGGGAVQVAYREHQGSREDPLCELSEEHVIELARREIAAVVGSGCQARFFLAGGAFKTLLTGRPPRDLDLWAPSTADREKLVEALEAHGAKPLPPTRFGDVFEAHDRIVEVPFKVEPSSLEGRLGQFDLALSAVGVEHRPGPEWRAVIHPLACECARRREVLLVRPLANWRHALSTLVRLERYADELGFDVPATETKEIWTLFDSQPRSMQEGMIDRINLSRPGADRVRAEALRRMKAV